MTERWLWADLPVGFGRALTTTREGGVSEGRYEGFNLATHVGDVDAAVARNRALLGEGIGLERIQWLDQVHGTRCIEVVASTTDGVPQADAAWTTQRGLALAVLTADCLPVLFCRRDGGAIAVAHAGWRGLVAGVLPSVLRMLPGACGDYVAWIGPAIGVAAYEVGEEVAQAVLDMSDAGDSAAFCVPASTTRVGKYQLDLAGLAARQLSYLGVAAVKGASVCSFTDQRFYSYRRDGSTGRMATLIWLPE
jgi:YfiH family protein